jgi:hypothetical protein
MARRFPLKDVSDALEPQTGKMLAEIRRLYFKTTRATIERDFDRAVDLLKSLPTIADRQRAHVYMEGLAEMRKEWTGARRRQRS